MRTFRDLDVWQKSVAFTTEIYKTTRTFPKEEMYGLVSQLRRASTSIPSNLAEGSKKSKKDFLRFIQIAQGSGAEIETQLLVAYNLRYIKKDTIDNLLRDLEVVMKMLTNLYKKLYTSVATN